jgi:hypothetical protein
LGKVIINIGNNLMSYKFSERVKQVLQEAGWYEGRRVDVSEAVRCLEKFGIAASPQVGMLLEEFHGLKINNGNAWYSFCVPDAMGWIEEEDIPYLNQLTGIDLCPFGYGIGMLLLVSPIGEIVMLQDEWIAYYHLPCLEDALEAAFFSDVESTYRFIPDAQKPYGFRDDAESDG